MDLLADLAQIMGRRETAPDARSDVRTTLRRRNFEHPGLRSGAYTSRNHRARVRDGRAIIGRSRSKGDVGDGRGGFRGRPLSRLESRVHTRPARLPGGEISARAAHRCSGTPSRIRVAQCLARRACHGLLRPSREIVFQHEGPAKDRQPGGRGDGARDRTRAARLGGAFPGRSDESKLGARGVSALDL